MNQFGLRRFIQALLRAALFLVSVDAAWGQFCNSNIPKSTPDADFVDHGDGTVTHNKTGLMWSRCLLGQSSNDCASGSATGYTWHQALEAAEASTLAGYSDWRLPNIKELASIVEMACFYPSININAFPNDNASSSGDTGLAVWSSSPDASYSGHAWVFRFTVGEDDWYCKDNLCYVRLVRGR